MNGDVESIQSTSNSINGKTDEVKATTAEIDGKMVLIGISTNNIIDRIGSMKGNTHHITSLFNSPRPLVSQLGRKTDLIQRLTNSLIALANELERRINLLK